MAEEFWMNLTVFIIMTCMQFVPGSSTCLPKYHMFTEHKDVVDGKPINSNQFYFNFLPHMHMSILN